MLIFLLIILSGFSCVNEDSPKNLSECNNYFDKTLDKKDIEFIKYLKEDNLSELHFSLGLNIRNKWLLGNRNPELVNYFRNLGLNHPDDISGVILHNYWCYLNNKDFDLKAQITKYIEYWNNENNYGEIEKSAIENTETKFKNSLVDVTYTENKKAPTLRIPIKKYFNYVFSNEFIKYKDGFIINSLITSPSGPGNIDISYNYYYFDLNNRQLYELNISGLDIVESIIEINNIIYIAGKHKKKNKIIKTTNSIVETINLNNTDKLEVFSNDCWIKLGKFQNQLYAIQDDGAYIYDGNYWKVISHFKLQEFLASSFGIDPIIPTENIRIGENKIYFLQEITQGRGCDLFELNIRTGDLSEFWTTNKILDCYAKKVNSYAILGKDSIFISTSILQHESLILKGDNVFTVYIYNDKIKSDSLGNHLVSVRTIMKESDKYIIVARNGLFMLKDSIIKPLAYFENTNQLVPVNKKNYYHFNFIPRCCELINPNTYLIGGLNGGLIIVDLNKNEVTCYDDKKDFKIIELITN